MSDDHDGTFDDGTFNDGGADDGADEAWSFRRTVLANVAIAFVHAHSLCLDAALRTPVGSARSVLLLRVTTGFRRAALALLRRMS